MALTVLLSSPPTRRLAALRTQKREQGDWQLENPPPTSSYYFFFSLMSWVNGDQQHHHAGCGDFGGEQSGCESCAQEVNSACDGTDECDKGEGESKKVGREGEEGGGDE
ncbi:hypothetical protein ACFX1Z_029736 [Malus domestica]